uniref:NADH dehydrogenase subunit 5 n=1 Tax=Gotra octocincta TaxID=3029099 RepID=UPI0023D7F917|nr:NADH dehydrogenase subunit 5 [Gotra octocincta]WDQ40358.1 NADH dehydrogenase subunit 5 [Gotra octocincta]
MFIYLFMIYMMFLFIFMIFLFMYLIFYKLEFFFEFLILNFMSLKMEILFYLDWVSILFVSVVLVISLMVIFYSIEYMEGDKKINQFNMLVILFVISMILMILSPNLISILLGWDGLGLSSYCLVIYYQNKISANSGMVTVLMNRVGDIMILMSIGLMMFNGSWNLIFLEKLNYNILYFLIIASFTKSAQIPFSSWLPMAMAAPTPVSALVHSSTLVTAGVYLMIRLNYLLNTKMLNFIMFISVMTMFMSSLGANFEFDLKKIIALSTLSQLGVMFFCLSMNLFEVSFFHLLTHAMFKSLLFMCSGVIIHNMMGYQDIRRISMIVYNMPLLSVMFNCSTMSLCGIPFLSGFYSKDMILEMYLMSLMNKFILLILFISMGLSVSYSIRLIYYTFIKLPEINLYKLSYMKFSYMILSMYMLFFFSVVIGSVLSWLLFSMKNKIYLEFQLKMMINWFILMGFIMGMVISYFFNKMKFFMMMKKYIYFFSTLWFMSLLYPIFNKKVLIFSNKLIMKVELGWMEYVEGGEMKKAIMRYFKLDLIPKKYFTLLTVIIYIIVYFWH